LFAELNAEALLAARDARQVALERALAEARGGAAAVVTLATNIPGPDKQLHGVECVLQRGWQELVGRHELRLLDQRVDALGPWRLAAAGGDLDPQQLKRAAVEIEGASPWARLLDVDVYDAETAGAVDRGALGLPPRACLLCGEPAHGCARARRHDRRARERRVHVLLAESRGEQRRDQALAHALVAGARAELELTPKPGLVDLEGPGSHPDLDVEAMRRSVALLPRYFDALLEARAEGAGLSALAAIGREAEARMWRAIGSNAHAGQIFLGGLLLAALPEPDAPADGGAPAIDRWRRRIGELADQHFAAAPAPSSHGARVRARYGVSGIAGEARAGLPLVFERALPCYRAARERGEDPRRATYRAMALTMQTLEDTTALHRCGEAGLARLRSDGVELAAQLDDDAAWPGEVERRLRALDVSYRAQNLTMGGVADSLALTVALSLLLDQLGEARAASWCS
jgi:holo-ACP synthase CitX